MVGTKETPKYIKAAKKAGCDITEVVADGAGHGFGQEYYMDQYLEWLDKIN